LRLAAGAFIGGAASRLLPASIPFRFFGAAVLYHLLAWIALGADPQRVPRFAGGLGWPLAALHLVTLGVLAMTAIGASLQLLPVATRQPVLSRRWPAAIWWLYTPGVAAVALGMGIPAPRLLAGGAVAVVAALAAYALLLARNLIGARGMPVVIAHGWAALASLIVVLASASSLAGAYVGFPGLERGMALAWHVTFAGYGFMGLLVLGLSYILVPMFALSGAPNERRARVSLSLAVAALLLSAAAAAATGVAAQALRIAAIGTGAGAVALHWRLMSVALKTGMRRELGRSLALVRMAWLMLTASLVAALGLVLDVPFDGMTALFGLLLIGGWLLSFLLGVLQRIVPFLASMHTAPGRRKPPTPSSLTAERPLSIHFGCHLAALALLAAAVIADSPWIAFAGAVLGMAGALAFGTFFAVVARRMSLPGVKGNRHEAPAS
jgi:hypothetical protein